MYICKLISFLKKDITLCKYTLKKVTDCSNYGSVNNHREENSDICLHVFGTHYQKAFIGFVYLL